MNILLCGCFGKMGNAVLKKVSETDGLTVAAGVDAAPLKADFPVFKSFDEINEKYDCIIDFSHPSVTDNLLAFVKKTKTPAVICTTGLSKEQIEKIKETAKEAPVFFSANMSLGVNLINELCKKAAELLYSDFDIEIIEKHHNQKIDAPSGTALMLANEINETLDGKLDFVYDRQSKREKRKKNEIGIHSLRGGNIVGEHEVIFAGHDETISIKHTATSKEVFALGAVKAAKFLVNQKPGLYSMKDMI